jgi:hypothetical protein
MITGANTNIRHRGMLFHVQTEDSGRANPHIISHVYHGGTIVASLKREYTDLVESPELAGEVKRLIEEQHKSMLKQLRGGHFDGAIETRLGGPTADADAQPAVPTAPELDDTGAPTDEPEATSGGETTGASTKPETDPLPLDDDEPHVPTERVPIPQPRAVRDGAAGFGEAEDAQKPLDEVILEYLVEKARERSEPNPQRRTRKKE